MPLRTSNPALQAFVKRDAYAAQDAKVMTLRGTVLATAVLTGLCAIVAISTYGYFASGATRSTGFSVMMIGLLVSFVTGLIMWAKPSTSPFCAPVCALGEGAFVGAMSWLVPTIYQKAPEGLVIQAVLLTFGIMFALLLGYGAGLIRFSSTTTKVILVATAGVAFYYLVVLIMNIAGFHRLSLGWSSSPIGIGFSVVVVVLASLNLVLDFQFIEAGIAGRAPRYMEWYGAYGLLVTLVWLYVEALRLLAKLNKR
jgi:uncharacterized YccA/Bax inhibitor family protein